MNESGRNLLGFALLLLPGKILSVLELVRCASGDSEKNPNTNGRLPSPPVTAAIRLVKENKKKIFAFCQLAMREI